MFTSVFSLTNFKDIYLFICSFVCLLQFHCVELINVEWRFDCLSYLCLLSDFWLVTYTCRCCDIKLLNTYTCITSHWAMSCIWYLYRVDILLCTWLLVMVIRESLSGCSAQELLSLIKMRYMCCWVLQSYWTCCHIQLHAVLVGILLDINNYYNVMFLYVWHDFWLNSSLWSLRLMLLMKYIFTKFLILVYLLNFSPHNIFYFIFVEYLFSFWICFLW